MLRVKRRTVVTVTAVVVVLLGGALAATLLTSGNSASASGKVVKGNTVEYLTGHRPLAPDFSAKSLTGTPIKMSSYRGKVLVLNFWGSWCPPCRAEAPTLEVAYQAYHAHGVDFLGDDIGENSPANGLSFLQSDHISYPSINDPGYSVTQQFSDVAPINDTPTTVVIDKTGHVAGIVLGQITYGELTTLLHEAAVTT